MKYFRHPNKCKHRLDHALKSIIINTLFAFFNLERKPISQETGTDVFYKYENNPTYPTGI